MKTHNVNTVYWQSATSGKDRLRNVFEQVLAKTDCDKVEEMDVRFVKLSDGLWKVTVSHD